MVDDVKSNRLLVGRVLIKLGFTVDLADDGDTAINCVKEKRPSIIFLDSTMPRLSGPNCAELLRGSMNETMPIIGITGNSLLEDCQPFIDAGANAVFVKPVSPKVILDICEEYL